LENIRSECSESVFIFHYPLHAYFRNEKFILKSKRTRSVKFFSERKTARPNTRVGFAVAYQRCRASSRKRSALTGGNRRVPFGFYRGRFFRSPRDIAGVGRPRPSAVSLVIIIIIRLAGHVVRDKRSRARVNRRERLPFGYIFNVSARQSCPVGRVFSPPSKCFLDVPRPRTTKTVPFGRPKITFLRSRHASRDFRTEFRARFHLR